MRQGFVVVMAVLWTGISVGCKPKDEAVDKEAKSAESATDKEGKGAATTSDPSAIPAPANVAEPPADAKKTDSGLQYKVLTEGKGETKPKPYDKVKVHYAGWKTDGTMFDSSHKRGQPAVFGVDQVIPGWTEALQLMRVGEKLRVWIPQDLAYKGRPGPPKGMLVFEMELIEIIPGVAPLPAPDDVAAAPQDAQKTESGLASKVLQAGTGKISPDPQDRVKVHYTGWQTDGKMFDSSHKRGQPTTFQVNKVIEGWTDALQLMVVGEKRRVWIPEELAYKGRPGPPKGMLVFDVELIEIEEMPDPPAVPKDVAAAPKNAKRTKSGLAYRVLKKGTGDAPSATDQVEVHYSGWQTDGKMFDSSVTRGRPATFRLNQVIAGWTEGLQLMKVGGRTRFWIPEELAYKGRPGAPQGMLVFDVELLSIKQSGAAPKPVHPVGATPKGAPDKAGTQAAAKPTADKPAAAKPNADKAAGAKPAAPQAAKPAAEATKPAAEATKPAAEPAKP